jgi:hypothetical protein
MQQSPRKIFLANFEKPFDRIIFVPLSGQSPTPCQTDAAGLSLWLIQACFLCSEWGVPQIFKESHRNITQI